MATRREFLYQVLWGALALGASSNLLVAAGGAETYVVKRGDTLSEIARRNGVTVRSLKQRNRLSHSFYREHNFRRNSDEGRVLMVQDLEAMHDAIIEAYKAVMRLSGIDLDKMTDTPLPNGHLPI